MTLASGTRLGSYEIRGSLGAGGMGEVYRASDTKLKREVAIKVLPEAFARDEARMKRFEREAQVLASLNHPNVAAIYGLEEADGIRALVLELVEGPTLAERIAPGPLPLDDALRIASQIAHGLEAAHDRAVIHRDLKPSNVKLTEDGDVKILDFGLAKALEVEPLPAEESNSPTLTRATQVGVLLGTAAYMSPEQARGKPADRRADVWSFGVVLYEMLTGRRAFAGEDVSETLAHVLTKEPDWSALPAGLPSPIRRLLERCLTKDPKKRLQAIGEARIAIEERGEEAPRRESSFWPALTGGLGLALGLAIWALWPRPTASPMTPVRLSAELGADAYFFRNVLEEGQAAILSSDGNLLAFVALSGPGAMQQIYLRRLEDLVASPLPGTEGARNPFFSPDGRWIGFFAEGKLKKVAVNGGGGATLADAFGIYGGSWGEDGAIVFGREQGEGLARVSSEGGDVEFLTNVDAEAGEVSHRWPQVLPGGKAILYSASTRGGGANLVVRAAPAGANKIVLPGAYHGRYLPSGHLVYIQEGTLFAVAFDLDRLEVKGRPARAVEGVASSATTAGARFAYSERGVLVYVPQHRPAESTISWMDGAGNQEPLRDIPGEYGTLRFSANGNRLAMEIRDRDQRDVWVYEWSRDALSRLTFDASDDSIPIWTTDGRRITFASDRADRGTTNLYWQRADGTGEAERLTVSDYRQWPGSWHPTGKFLAFCEMRLGTASPDVLILPMEGSEESGWKPGKPWPFLDSSRVENTPEFSPDGRWIAYMSNDTGRFEVFVRPFPEAGGKWQVSTAGGQYPTWSSTRPEIFYYAPDERIMVVPYTVEGDQFVAGKARLWSQERIDAWGNAALGLHPDGKRFAVVTNLLESQARQDKVVFILNFFDYLRQIAPPQ
jgi:serine/threonine-protein kinase